MLQNRNTSPNQHLASLVKRAHPLLLFVLSGVILVGPMSAQSFEAANTITGNILGAMMGVEAIDRQRWIAPLELREVIEQVAIDLVTWPWWAAERGEIWERYPGY